MKPETLEYKLRVYKDRLSSMDVTNEAYNFYADAVADMERTLTNEPTVWENLIRNLFGQREQREVYTDDFQEYLMLIRTQDVEDADRRWLWRKFDFVYYVRYRQ